MSAQMRSRAPRANAGNRAEVIRNDASLTSAALDAIGDKEGCAELADVTFRSIEMPSVSSFISFLIRHKT